jgi:hypothetical protein
MCVCLLCGWRADGEFFTDALFSYISLYSAVLPFLMDDPSHIAIYSRFFLPFPVVVCVVVFYIRERHQYFHSERTCTIGDSAFSLFFPIAMGDADWTKTENKKKKKKIVGKAFNLIATGLYSHSRGR